MVMEKRTNVYRRLGWLACRSTCNFVLLVVRVDALQHISSSRNYQVSKKILEGLQSSSSKKNDVSNHLDLETDFYDASTGLYSEGVWHNCMAGIASLQLSHVHQHEQQQQQQHYNDATRIAASLFRYSWDGISFRRRVWNGNWDHSPLQLVDTDIVQANYYKESSEHRCIQHGIALIFWSMLAQYNSDDNSNVRSQQSLILKQFIREFWNDQRWTTISRNQGSGTLLRPSASSGVASRTTSTESDSLPYFRAVDQAIAVLACLQHLQLLNSENKSDSIKSDERNRIINIIQTTCKDLLNDKGGFGYNNLSNARTYLGVRRNRNFWHEGWVVLALISAREYIWPMDSQEGHLKILWNSLMKQYTNSTAITSATKIGQDYDNVNTTIWHWDLSEKDVESNVRYCGDNALAYAIHRIMIGTKLLTGEDENDDYDDTFWSFIEMLRSNNKSSNNKFQLASVADVYSQVRLHPNTELASLLVWPPLYIDKGAKTVAFWRTEEK